VEKTLLTVEKKTAHVEIKLKPKTWVDPSALAKAIDEGGYKARREEIRLTMTGTLSRENDVYLFTLGDMTTQPPLVFKVLGDSVLLEPLVGKSVKIEGAWKAIKKGESYPTLQLLKISPEKD
jgi:hypothetical protein